MRSLKRKRSVFLFKEKRNNPTGTCLILITPDSERTMVTFLGTAGKINENDIDNAVKNSEILFLEGYLWDEGEPKKLSKKQLITLIKLRCPCQTCLWRDINLTF